MQSHRPGYSKFGSFQIVTISADSVNVGLVTRCNDALCQVPWLCDLVSHLSVEILNVDLLSTAQVCQVLSDV